MGKIRNIVLTKGSKIQTEKVNLVTSEDVKNVFKPKKKVEEPQVEDMLKQSKKSNNNIVISPMSPKDQAVITPDSGQGRQSIEIRNDYFL